MRVVVKLSRGEDVWHVDVPDAEGDEHAANIALMHANGFHDPIAGVMVGPSNGERGWQVDALLDELPHEVEGRQRGRKPKPHWNRRRFGYEDVR